MKKGLLIFMFVSIAFSVRATAENQVGKIAAKAAINSFIVYYTALNKIDTPMPSKTDIENRLSFLRSRKAAISEIITEADVSHNFISAFHLFDNYYRQQTAHLSYFNKPRTATAPAYFDTKTGHRYVRRNDNAYLEYSKKGKFIKIAAANQPLLLKSRNIHPITPGTYILYEKWNHTKPVYLSLPSQAPHPKGWRACKLMAVLD